MGGNVAFQVCYTWENGHAHVTGLKVSVTPAGWECHDDVILLDAIRSSEGETAGCLCEKGLVGAEPPSPPRPPPGVSKGESSSSQASDGQSWW